MKSPVKWRFLFVLVRMVDNLHSIVETAKANNLKVYDYLEFLLTELPKHSEDTDREFLKKLLPWTKAVQEKCSNRKKS